MLNKLRDLLGLCKHKWEVYKFRNILNPRNQIIGFMYVKECQRCGKSKITKYYV